MAIKKPKYYAYFIPPDGPQGVTDNWKKTEKMVIGKTGARYKSFDTKKEAELWLAHGARYEARPGRDAAGRPLEPGIYFDAGTGRGEGVEVSVTDEKGNNLLHKAIDAGELNKFGKYLVTAVPDDEAATNNYGELLAFRYALEVAEKTGARRIFGDSRLVIDYWSRWRIKRSELPEETVALANEVAKLRETFEAGGGSVTRISGDRNPADLGFHK